MYTTKLVFDFPLKPRQEKNVVFSSNSFNCVLFFFYWPSCLNFGVFKNNHRWKIFHKHGNKFLRYISELCISIHIIYAMPFAFFFYWLELWSNCVDVEFKSMTEMFNLFCRVNEYFFSCRIRWHFLQNRPSKHFLYFILFYFVFFYLILFRVVVVSTAQFSTLWSLAFWPTLADTFFRSIKRKKKNAEKRRKMHKHSEIQFFTSLEKWKLLIIEKHNEPCNSITIIILFVIY